MMTTTNVIKEALLSPMIKADRQTKTVSKKKASGQKVTEYAERISDNWQKTIGCILKVATDCSAAKIEFTLSEKQELIEQLPFGESMFSKLASIGDDRRLNEHQELLPPSISTLYLIQSLSDEQFEAAVTETVLRPDVTRDKFREWTLGKTDRPARSKSSDLELPLALYCVYSEKLLRAEEHVQVHNALVSVAESEGLKAHVFTGENLIAQIKAFFNKQAGAA